MTTRPRLHTDTSQVVGLVAFVLFGVFAVVFLTADFGPHATFEGATGITASIGYAMFDLEAGSLPSEGFLISFEIIDIVLVAALAAAVMLGTRDEEEDDDVAVADGGTERDSRGDR